MYVCMYVCMYVRMYVCVYIYICIFYYSHNKDPPPRKAVEAIMKAP